MTRWRFVEPGPVGDPDPVIVTVSEDEILANYYPFWAERMRAAGKEDDVSEANCIEDWVIVNWAERVPE